MKATEVEGGCLCGWIRFKARGKAGKPHTCSCRMCQRHTGALTATWVEYPREDVQWVGPGGAPSTYRSSAWSSRAFCPRCGSSIGAVDDAPVVALLTGVFDRPGAAMLRPAYHSYRSQRPRWWCVEIKTSTPAQSTEASGTAEGDDARPNSGIAVRSDRTARTPGP